MFNAQERQIWTNPASTFTDKILKKFRSTVVDLSVDHQYVESVCSQTTLHTSRCRCQRRRRTRQRHRRQVVHPHRRITHTAVVGTLAWRLFFDVGLPAKWARRLRLAWYQPRQLVPQRIIKNHRVIESVDPVDLHRRRQPRNGYPCYQGARETVLLRLIKEEASGIYLDRSVPTITKGPNSFSRVILDPRM